MDADDVAVAVNTALFGQTASTVLEGDRVVSIRVLADRNRLAELTNIQKLPIRSPTGTMVLLSQVADLREEPGELELRRDDLRQVVAVTARLEGRDLGSAMDEIRRILPEKVPSLPAGTVEFGGLYQQQQESFHNLLIVLTTAILLVFTVLLLEFRSYLQPLAIVFGAVLALLGTILALWITGTSLNIISFLARHHRRHRRQKWYSHARLRRASAEAGGALIESLVRSGRRRLRPVLMTSLAAALGMLPWPTASAPARIRFGRWPSRSSGHCAFRCCSHWWQRRFSII
jgi:multidrug efflux pump subunit AcrB